MDRSDTGSIWLPQKRSEEVVKERKDVDQKVHPDVHKLLEIADYQTDQGEEKDPHIEIWQGKKEAPVREDLHQRKLV
jgi:hypothetical protein